MAKKNNYPPGSVASKEEMLALADKFAKEDTEDGFTATRIEEAGMSPERQAIRTKYARWQKQDERLEYRKRILADRLWKIQDSCSHPEEEGHPPFNGEDGKYTCRDCGRVRRVPHRDAQW